MTTSNESIGKVWTKVSTGADQVIVEALSNGIQWRVDISEPADINGHSLIVDKSIFIPTNGNNLYLKSNVPAGSAIVTTDSH